MNTTKNRRSTSHPPSRPVSRRLAIHLAPLLAFLLFVAPSSAQEGEGAAGDPTRASAEMEEVLRALRSSEEETAASDSSPRRPVQRITLAGLVVAGGRDPATASGTAILQMGDSFFLATEGQTVVSGNRRLVVETVDAAVVQLEEEGGEELVLRSRRLPASFGRNDDLAVVEFQEVPLHLAARALSDETGIRIASSTESRDTPVNLYLREVAGSDALDALVLTHRLYMSDVPDARIVRLHTTDEYARDAGTFRDERTEVFTLKYPNARDVALAIGDLFGDRVQLSNRFDDEDEPGEHLTEDLEQRMERFDIIDARGQGFGVDASDGQGTQGNRSLTSRLDSDRFSRNSRSFRNRERLRDGDRTERERLTAEDELSPEEIASLEAGDARVIEQVLRQRADIWVTVIDRLNKVMVRTRDEATMAEIADLVHSLDVPTPLVLLEVKIMEVALERGLETAFDWSFDSGNWSGRFAPGGPVTSGDLVFNFLDDTFQTQIEMLQRADKLTMLGKPMLLTANNEVSRLFIGEEVPLNRNFQGGDTVVTDGGPILSPSNTDIEFRPVGSTLLITPNINDDRTVSLRVLQEESRVVQAGADVLVPEAGGGFVNRSIDTVASQTASGTFVASDGETIAVGGMITEKLSSQRSQIPILGDIPGLGLLARNQRIGRERKEIVLLLTPHIIKNPGEGEGVSRKLVEGNSFHPNAPDGEGQLGSFVHPNVLTTGSEEYGPLEKIQERQILRAKPVQFEEKASAAPPRKKFRLFPRN